MSSLYGQRSKAVSFGQPKLGKAAGLRFFLMQSPVIPNNRTSELTRQPAVAGDELKHPSPICCLDDEPAQEKADAQTQPAATMNREQYK